MPSPVAQRRMITPPTAEANARAIQMMYSPACNFPLCTEPMPHLHRQLLLLIIVPALAIAWTGCSFDRSGLNLKVQCVSDGDCPREQRCVSNICGGSVEGDRADAYEGIDDSGLTPDYGARGDAAAGDTGAGDASDATAGGEDCESRNRCGGCDELDNAPGTTCGTGACGRGVWVCASENAVECAASEGDVNLCGGCEPLDRGPGVECGDCGETRCETGAESVRCVDPGHNQCGGCQVLDHLEFDSCGTCDDGHYRCNDDGGLDCTNATQLNACGTCGALNGVPDAACGACGGGTWQCTADRLSVECVGSSAVNACGGCVALEATAGTACGACSDGVWTCAEGDLVCAVASPDNACGGCGTLTAEPDTVCGECDLGTWTCNGDNTAVECTGDPGENLCGGCGTLAGTPTTECGDCTVGTWTCNGDGSAVTCAGDPGFNACGGCGVLGAPPETACGDCSDGLWTCNINKDAVECVGDPGVNACGGCETLDGVPTTSCTCGGAGQATYHCDGLDAVSCYDENSVAAWAPHIASINEEQSTSGTGTVDHIGDADWYVVHVEDKNGPRIQPTAWVTTSTPGMTFEICVYYRYDESRNLGNYDCADGDRCVWYDASSDNVVSGDCSSTGDFDGNADLYGCCDSVLGANIENAYHARINGGVDGSWDESGWAYTQVRPTGNLVDGCANYSFSVGF